MSLAIITADQRLAEANSKTTMAISSALGRRKDLAAAGPSRRDHALRRPRGGHEVGAGLAGRQHPGPSLARRRGHRLPYRRDRPGGGCERLFLQGHDQHVAETYPDLVRPSVTVNSQSRLSTSLPGVFEGLSRPWSISGLAVHAAWADGHGDLGKRAVGNEFVVFACGSTSLKSYMSMISVLRVVGGQSVRRVRLILVSSAPRLGGSVTFRFPERSLAGRP